MLLAGFPGVAGHLTRLLAVAQARPRGFDAEFFVLDPGPFATHVTDAGCTPVVTRTVPLDLWSVSDRDFAVRMLGAWFRRAVAEAMTVMKSIAPDCVVVDTHWAAMAAATALDVPTLAVTNAVWTTHRRALGLADESDFELFAALFADAAAPALRAVGVGEQALEALQHGTKTHIADLPALLGAPLGLDPDTTAGPLLWWPGASPRVEWPAGDGPTAYMTAGSTGVLRDIDAAAMTLAERGWRVVVSGANDDGVVGNVVRTRFCDPRPLLETADVAVLHGGSGSLLQALACGVPVVVVPANLDQLAHAELVERAGAGVMLGPAARAFTVDAVTDLRDDEPARVRATELASMIRTEDATATVARTLSALAGVAV
ncbi:MAG TPA: nucleotide disphospho-sugar-binding domain-containing protein [Acidimicrobiia bacterium]|nr:nucleotide disphospho-sugar-binding domain-containing protein [Acidimicrobiia bacterium]